MQKYLLHSRPRLVTLVVGSSLKERLYMTRAVFAGSFDPFTNGHLDMVKKASKIFDEVTVVIASNANKKRKTNAEEMRQAIKDCLDRMNLTNCKVDICTGLLGKYCIDNNIGYNVRGLRSNGDYEYEEMLARGNNEIDPYLETIYLRTKNSTISSSLVREFFFYGEDVSAYIPPESLEVMNRALAAE